MRHPAQAAATAFTILSLATAVSAAPPPATVSNAWIRALPGGLPAGGYFTLHNDGDKELVLTGARSPSCGTLMLHKSEMSGGVSRMIGVDRVEVAPHAAVSFSPGGYHLMCVHPSPGLAPGAVANVTLQFEDGSSISASFSVKNAQGAGMPQMH
jgi:periplasmic copper chaperone A